MLLSYMINKRKRKLIHKKYESNADHDIYRMTFVVEMQRLSKRRGRYLSPIDLNPKLLSVPHVLYSNALRRSSQIEDRTAPTTTQCGPHRQHRNKGVRGSRTTGTGETQKKLKRVRTYGARRSTAANLSSTRMYPRLAERTSRRTCS